MLQVASRGHFLRSSPVSTSTTLQREKEQLYKVSLPSSSTTQRQQQQHRISLHGYNQQYDGFHLVCIWQVGIKLHYGKHIKNNSNKGIILLLVVDK